ncbi:MAG: hypothetical protein HY917_05760 [Candidatus Diapherotrites archaeon]|nr:hypothetical protein [Candidatus Diapherotrites archaeon]
MVINFNAKVEGIEGFECGKEYDCGWFWFNSGSWFEFDNSRKISVTEGGWNYTVTPKKIIFKLTPKSPGKPEVVSPEITFTVNKSAETAPTEQGFKITAVTASCKAAGPFKLADMDSLTVDYVNGKKFNVLEIWVLAPAETDHLTGPDNVKKADGFTNKEWKDAHRDRWFVLVNAGNANPEKPTGYVSGEALPVNYAAQKTMSKTIKGENYPLSGNDSLGVGQKWKPFGALQANAEYTLQEFNEYIDSLNERLDPDLRYYAVIQTSETGAYAASDTITDAARIINQCQSGETPVVTAKITQPTQTTFAYSPKMQIDFTATVNGTVPVCGEKGILCSWTVVSSASKDIKSFFYDAQNKLSIVTVSGQDISSVNANWRAGPGKYTVHFALLKDFAIAPPLAEDSLEITLTESPCASCSTILGCLMCVDKKIAETVFMTAEETARKEESMKPMPVIEKPVSSGMIEFKYGDSEPRTLALTEFTKTAITLSSGSGFDFRVGSDSGAVSVRISDKGNSVLILRLKDQSVCQETVYVTVPAVINKCGISFKAEVLPPATDNPGGDPYFKLSAFTFSDYIWPSNPATSPGELPPSKGKGTVPAGSILLTSPGKDPVSVDFAGLPAQNVVFPLTGGTATIQTTGEKWGLALSGNSNPSIQITHDGISCDAPYVYSSFNQAYSNYSCGLSFGFKKIPEANNSRYALYALTLSGLNAIFYRSYETVGPEPGYELISSPASPVTLKGTWNGSRDGLAINLEEPAQNGIEISFGKKNWAIKAIPNPINNGIDAFQITGPAGNTCKTEEKLLNNGSFSSDWVSFNAPECGIPSFEAGWNDFGTSVDLFVRNIQLNVQ